VETEEQARLLRAAGCEEAQGYLFCRPVAADDFQRWLDARGPSGPERTG
jgi:EAL domain-containing protein (putative c-di-GMP-specific phosphodiesterase class I)